jgi:hypothetical protein
MTIPPAYCLAVDLHGRRSQAGDNGGCPSQPALPQIEPNSYDKRTCRGDQQPRQRPTGSLDGSAPWRRARAGGHPLTHKSP